MSARVPHRYVAEIRLVGGETIGTPALEVDWTPAVEWSHFQSIRRGAAGVNSLPGAACVRPNWDRQSGPPYVESVDVALADSAGDPHRIPLRLFAEPVQRAASALVQAGRIDDGAAYTWRICAYDAQIAEPGAHEAFTVQEAPAVDARLAACRLRNLRRRAVHQGPARGRGEPRDYPVFVGRTVLHDAAGTAVAAGEREAGGILLGRLLRNGGCGDIVLEITAQVPAVEAVAEIASLRFTPRTWQTVEAAIRLRRSSERIVGWWHSHPRKVWPCHACPDERRARCPSNRPFFSSMDVAFHRTAFQAPINVALLVSFQEGPAPLLDLFGWRQGVVAAREYFVLEDGK